MLLAGLGVQGAALGQAPQGQTAWFEGFEGPNPSWLEAGGDVRYSLQQHRRVPGLAHTGQGCEWFQLTGPSGSAIYIGHDVGRPWVIEELRPSVWVKSDRAGLQLLAEIGLPRTPDPRTGLARTTNIVGTTYTAVGRWQQLTITDMPRQLTRQLRILRSQVGGAVDGREAYLNRVLLNIYGGPGETNVWIDDLALAGHVASGLGPVEPSAARPIARPVAAATAQNVGLREPLRQAAQLSGSVLVTNGRPMFPRAIQYRGEPLAMLKQLGFNTIWLKQIPPVELLEEARRQGLWLVCPPPRPPASDPAQPAMAPPAPIGAEFQPVLAWDLGPGEEPPGSTAAALLESNRQWSDYIRMADGRQHRPLICSPTNDLRGYSRHVDLLLIDRRPLGTSLEMNDFGVWVRRQPLLARPGTPVWTTIQTQPSEALQRQLAALEPGRAPPSAVAPEQIRLLVYMAISSGSRGLVFQSQTPLDAGDPESRQRAMTLQLLNLELELIEPWAAAGSFVALAESTERQVTGAVLRSDRARLVLPVWLAPGAQCVPPQATASALAMVVPGVPESSSAYELTSGRLEPLRRKRETGGTRVTLEEFGLTALVLFAQDPLVIDAVTRRASVNVRSSAELERHLAARKLDTVGQLVGQLGQRTPPRLNVAEQFAAARQNLQLCDARLAAGDFQSASLFARRASRPLRLLERAHWEAATAGWGSPVVSPGTASFDTLPWHWRLVDRLAAARPGPNQLPTGNFEDFNQMIGSGWRHYQHAAEGIHTAADLVVEAAHSGHWGLRLTARADDPENPPAMIETSPLWITSPAVMVEAGQLVRVHGWVNIPAAITGSVDGLLVVDSLAGLDMAQRIDKTAGWREFTLFRAAPQSGPMTVTLALSGLGEVRLDDVSIEVMGRN